MKTNFAKVMTHVFKHEGGYVDVPQDTGGATNMGVTIGVLSGWRGYKVSKSEVKNLKKTEAKEIFRSRYWNPLMCDDMAKGVDYCVMDYGVNSGISRSAKYTQRIVGVIPDGKIGPITLAAIKTFGDEEKFIRELCLRRQGFLDAIVRNRPSQRIFIRGWTRRVKEVLRDALAMVSSKKRKPKPSTTPIISRWW